MEITSWREIAGNPFLKTIDPRMLSSNGLLVRVVGNTKNQALKSKAEKQSLIVRYDKEFVISKLAYVLKPIANRKDLGDILSQALEDINSNKNTQGE